MSPMYDYLCEKCGATKEIIKPIKEIDREEWCKCQKKYPMKRLCGNKGGFRLGDKGNVSWAKGGYSSYMGDIWKHEAK